VTNTGSVDDTYTLENNDNSGWSLSISLPSLTVPAGESRTATLSVTIPENAAICTRDNITIRATSQGDNTVSAENSCTAHVIGKVAPGWGLPSILAILAAIVAGTTASALAVRYLKKRKRKKRRRAEARRLKRLKGIIEGEE
jgi:hypothetical protein